MLLFSSFRKGCSSIECAWVRAREKKEKGFGSSVIVLVV